MVLKSMGRNVQSYDYEVQTFKNPDMYIKIKLFMQSKDTEHS